MRQIRVFVGIFCRSGEPVLYIQGMLGKYGRDYIETLRVGLPIVLGQLGIIILGFADNIMVGRYGTEELAAASFVNAVFNIPIFFGLGFSYGLTPLVGEAYGRGDKEKAGRWLKEGVVCNGIIGILMSLAMWAVYMNVERMGQPRELLPLIRPYFLLQLASLFFIMIFNGFKQFFDGITDTLIPMWIMFFANTLNIAGNYLLIYGKWGFPEWGLVGAGISTLFSRILMPVLIALVFFRNLRRRPFKKGFINSACTGKDLKRLFTMGGMIGFQMGMETVLFSLTAVMVGWLGTVELAAHQIGITLSTLGYMVYYGVGAALSVRMSNACGSEDWGRVRRASVAGFHIILVLALVISCIFGFSRSFIGGIFTSEQAVIRQVSVLIFILILYQFGDGLQIAYANSLRGVSDVKPLAVLSFIGYFVIALPVSYLLGFVFDMGIVGIWTGYPVGLTLTGLMLYIRYRYLIRKLSVS